MINLIVRYLSAFCLLLLFIFPGNAQEKKQEEAEDTQKTLSGLKSDIYNFPFSLISRETLSEYEKMRRRFSALKLHSNSISPVKRRKMHEISLFGSYLISLGGSTMKRGESGIFSGMYSPWFGKGYDEFHWSGTNVPKSLDNVIGAAVVVQKNIFLAGFKFAINVLPRFQIEMVYKGGESILSFNDEAWELIDSIIPDSVSTLKEADRDVFFSDNSDKSSGDINMYGLNVNFNILNSGPIIPYVSLGLMAINHEGAPKIEYELSQFYAGPGEAKYYLIVDYDTGDESVVPNFGLGAKIFLGKNLGIKVETRTTFNVLALEQIVATDFRRDSWGWLEYEGFYEVVATQRINRFTIDGGIGVFFTW